jgi:hypothetical protein
MISALGHCWIVSKSKPFKVFSNFDEENKAEYRRRSRMSPQERMNEFAVLQERAWGIGWRTMPMDRKATWENVDW